MVRKGVDVENIIIERGMFDVEGKKRKEEVFQQTKL